MRTAFLVLLSVLLVANAYAQTTPETPEEQPEQQNSAAEPQATAPVQPSAPAGLQLGHPLDPADVAVLTGKGQTTLPAAARSPYAAAYGVVPYYYPYNMNVPIFGKTGVQSWNHLGQPFFFPTFGRFNPHLFFGFESFRHGGPGVVLPPFGRP
jgi:hypothetical protein